MGDEFMTGNWGRTYEHTFPDGTWISMRFADGGGPKSPPRIFTALQRDPLHDLPPAMVLSERHFVKDGRINWTGMMYAMKLVPDDFTGPVFIDVESPFDEDGSVKPPWTFTDLRNIALFCATSRPSVEWGWYGIPTRSYWHQDEAWRNNNLALQAVTEVMKCLAPSIYDYYSIRPDRDNARYGSIVSLAAEMAASSQQVLAFTHHRYHMSTAIYGYRLIPDPEYLDHMRNAVRAGVDGIVAWGGDRSKFINAWKRKPDGQFEFTGEVWDRIREAWRTEQPGVQDPVASQVDTYLFQYLYPSLHERLTSL
jgi:hypothetical protein